jgi:hypothetical protein
MRFEVQTPVTKKSRGGERRKGGGGEGRRGERKINFCCFKLPSL